MKVPRGKRSANLPRLTLPAPITNELGTGLTHIPKLRHGYVTQRKQDERNLSLQEAFSTAWSERARLLLPKR